MTRRKAAVGCLSTVVWLALAAPHSGLRWNHTPSMPTGLWLERPAPVGYVAGDVVEACPVLADWQRVYLSPGDCPGALEPMLKPVAAVPGDQVAVDQNDVSVNGMVLPYSAALTHDSRGRPLHPFPPGTYEVAPGYVWLMVPRRDSLDSRYLGPVAITNIRGLAVPLWVSK